MNRSLAWILSAAACVVIAAGGIWLWHEAFLRNPAYAVKNVSIETGHAKTSEEIRTLTGIREGVNIFSFSAAEKRRELLENSLNIADVRIVKHLPDSVSVKVFDRVPAAKLSSATLAVDAGGLVFTILANEEGRYKADVPVIENGSQRLVFDAGRRLEGVEGTPVETESKVMRALQVIKRSALREKRVFKMLYADISNPVYLSLDNGNICARLVWEEIRGDAEIDLALDLLDETLRHPDAGNFTRFDVILANKRVIGGIN